MVTFLVRFLVVGFAAGNIPKIPLNLVLLKGCQVIGVFWGLFFRKNPSANARNFNTILKWIKNKKLNIHIDKKFLLKDAKKALNYVMNRKVKGIIRRALKNGFDLSTIKNYDPKLFLVTFIGTIVHKS